MERTLSLVEMAVRGYDPSRVRKGSWLEKAFGPKNVEVKDNGSIGRSDQNKEQQAGR